MKYRSKTTKYLTVSLIAAILSLTGASAIAEGGKGKRMFEKADLDGDRLISFDEFQPRKQRGTRADLDRDGQVTRSEMNEHANSRSDDILERAEQHFSRMDLNGDDIITKEEARQAAFNHLDKDEDGHLSPKEMKRAKQRHNNRKG